MLNLYRTKMKVKKSQVQDAGMHSMITHLPFIDANEATDIFLPFIINGQGPFQSSQCLRSLVYLLTLSKP